MTHLRRTPRHFAHVERRVFQADFVDCPTCGSPLDTCNHYTFSKTIQRLDGVFSIAARPRKCPNPACPAVGQPLVSAAAQALSLPDSTYGLDVLAQIGAWRDQDHLRGKAIHARLTARGVQLSRRQVDLLTAQYRCLLSAAAQDEAPLVQAVARRGGLILALDGLEPEGAQEQLWVVREVLSGRIVLVGWLARTSKENFTAFLEPVVRLLRERGWRLLATVSDRERALEAALQELWPTVPHQWCQAHYLRNLSKPIQAQDQALRVELRQALRSDQREHERQDRARTPGTTAAAFPPGVAGGRGAAAAAGAAGGGAGAGAAGALPASPTSGVGPQRAGRPGVRGTALGRRVGGDPGLAAAQPPEPGGRRIGALGGAAEHGVGGAGGAAGGGAAGGGVGGGDPGGAGARGGGGSERRAGRRGSAGVRGSAAGHRGGAGTERVASGGAAARAGGE